MTKASLVVHPFYNNNRIFNLEDKTINRDNCLYCFHELRETLLQSKILLATSDINKPEESDIVIFNEVPDTFQKSHNPQKSYLILFETDVIRPQNWDLKLHKKFKKIFTWNDDFIDNKQYIKINFSHLFPEKISRISFSNRKLCTLIAGNKSVNHPLELYSQRLKTIHWFEKNHPQDFDYYGIGWSDINLGHPFLNKIAKKLKLAQLFPSQPSLCYKGSVESKLKTLENYKFSICYENAEKISGYITEKIFDSFFAGCIPVYWGAPNISDFIPKTCFINRSDFANHEDLYLFLTQMPKSEFDDRLDAIDAFLRDNSSKPFSTTYFSQTIRDHVTK